MDDDSLHDLGEHSRPLQPVHQPLPEHQRQQQRLPLQEHQYVCSLANVFVTPILISLQTPQPTATTTTTGVHPTAYKSVEAAASGPTLVNANPGDHYPPISQVLNTTNPGAVQWQTTRPTLTGGLASGRMSGMLIECHIVITYRPIHRQVHPHR